MDEKLLFELPEVDSPRQPAEPAPRIGPRRMRCAVRNQVEFQECSLEELLPEDHEARIVWNYVEELDLSSVCSEIQTVEGGPGHPPADPRILFALWLYATLRGIGSARELNRLCKDQAANTARLGWLRTSSGRLSTRRFAALGEHSPYRR